MTTAEVLEFGDVRVDTGRMKVTRAGQPVALEPKAYDVLLLLLRHRDRVVLKDELLDQVWKDTFVTPNVLTRAVVQLRKGLGDDAQEARYIETVARRGYRLIADVRASRPEPFATRVAPETSTWRSRLPLRARLGAGLLIFLSAAVLVGWTLQRRSATPLSASVGPSPDLAPRRFTTRSGYFAMPSWSPDGRAVAYVSDQAGNLEISTVALTPGSREAAVTNDGGTNTEPAWSPDGRWIAYHSRGRGGIWVVPASGGVARQVADFGSSPAWSPDSARLVFTSYAGGLVSQSELWIVNRDGGGRRPLTRVGTPVGGHRAPAWSPDGRHVAFISAEGGWDGTVWTVSVADGRTVKVGSGDAAPAFDPRGGWLYWAVNDPGGGSHLVRVAIDANTGSPRAAAERVGSEVQGYLTGLSIARDGTAAFGLTTDTGNLWAVDLLPDGPPPDPVQLTDDVVRNAYPNYSPDGRLAFIQIVPRRPATTWIMRDDGGGREPLVPDVEATSPQWDPTGRRLFVLRWPQSALWVDVATRQMSPIPVSVANARGLRLSPDATRLAYYEIGSNGVLNVFTRGLDAGPPRQITRDPEAASYPAWSPDGRHLAVEVKRGSSTHLAVVAAEGGPLEVLVNDRGQSWPHSWSPDGERIAFAGERDGVWNVWEVSRRTKIARPLTRFTSPVGYVRYPAWSPNGRRIVFERQSPKAGVWTLRLP